MSNQLNRVQFLAYWLRTAAEDQGKLEDVRQLIRRAMEAAVEMYGLIEETQIEDADEEIPGIVSEFASYWDEGGRLTEHEDVSKVAQPEPNASARRSAIEAKDRWRNNPGTRAAAINALLSECEWMTKKELLDHLKVQFPKITLASIGGHIDYLRTEFPENLEQRPDGREMRYHLKT